MGAGVVKSSHDGGSRRRRRGGRAVPMSEINVTPFVDVMLVLLIIFMVAAPLMTVGVPVELTFSAARRSASTALLVEKRARSTHPVMWPADNNTKLKAATSPGQPCGEMASRRTCPGCCSGMKAPRGTSTTTASSLAASERR